jgi:ribonuclease HI
LSNEFTNQGAGITVKSPTRGTDNLRNRHHGFQFNVTNNMAEYEALLHGLRIAREIGIKHIICCGDSNLVAQQVAGIWNTRNFVMAAYRDEVDEMVKCFR